MPTQIGFGPIKDDDELLDRLGSRSSVADDGLEGLFASWTASIDADERAAARDVGPLGLRVPGLPDEVEQAERLRVVRVHRTRAAAVLGALALTVSGGGVAAAYNQTELAPVRAVIERAVLSAQRPTPSETALPEMVAKAQDAVANGQYDKAQGMMEVIRSLASKDPNGAQITRQVNQLAEQMGQPPASPVVVAEMPTKTPTTTTSSTTSAPAAPAPIVPATVAAAPPSVSSTSDDGKSSTSSSSTATKDPTSSPTDPPTTTEVTGLGNAGGRQSAGTSDPETTRPVETAPPETSGRAGRSVDTHGDTHGDGGGSRGAGARSHSHTAAAVEGGTGSGPAGAVASHSTAERTPEHTRSGSVSNTPVGSGSEVSHAATDRSRQG